MMEEGRKDHLMKKLKILDKSVKHSREEKMGKEEAVEKMHKVMAEEMANKEIIKVKVGSEMKE
jgi:uncharacterized protein YoaH (UPF0181 family)